MYKPTDFRRAVEPRSYADMLIYFGPHLSTSARRKLMPEVDWVDSLKAYVIYRPWSAEDVLAHFNQRVGVPDTPMAALVSQVARERSGVPDPRKAAKWRAGAAHYGESHAAAITAVAAAIETGDVPVWADIRAGDLLAYCDAKSWAEAAGRWPYLKGGDDRRWQELRDTLASLLDTRCK